MQGLHLWELIATHSLEACRSRTDECSRKTLWKRNNEDHPLMQICWSEQHLLLLWQVSTAECRALVDAGMSIALTLAGRAPGQSTSGPAARLGNKCTFLLGLDGDLVTAVHTPYWKSVTVYAFPSARLLVKTPVTS